MKQVSLSWRESCRRSRGAAPPRSLLLVRDVREDPSSIPIRNTARNSEPFALCSVISVTRLVSPRSASWSE